MGMRGNAQYCFQDIIGKSSSLEKCKGKAILAARTSSSVLIYGETGTGKEMFVQAIHKGSDRCDRPFIAENCAAIPSTLLESILFGTVKGSFTGAEDRKGLFELAHCGTLYLDELNSMPVGLQGKLLRVLQEGTFSRVGSTTVRKVDVRVIATLNEKPELLLEQGRLRTDLFYRLEVVRIDIPPLRERKEDIPLIVDHLIDKLNKRFNAKIKGLETNALATLVALNWEGNIRELEHTIEGVFNFKQEGLINNQDLSELGINVNSNTQSLKLRMQEIEKTYIKEALIITENNISRAAEFLEIPRQTLQSKLQKYKLL